MTSYITFFFQELRRHVPVVLLGWALPLAGLLGLSAIDRDALGGDHPTVAALLLLSTLFGTPLLIVVMAARTWASDVNDHVARWYYAQPLSAVGLVVMRALAVMAWTGIAILIGSILFALEPSLAHVEPLDQPWMLPLLAVFIYCIATGLLASWLMRSAAGALGVWIAFTTVAVLAGAWLCTLGNPLLVELFQPDAYWVAWEDLPWSPTTWLVPFFLIGALGAFAALVHGSWRGPLQTRPFRAAVWLVVSVLAAAGATIYLTRGPYRADTHDVTVRIGPIALLGLEDYGFGPELRHLALDDGKTIRRLKLFGAEPWIELSPDHSRAVVRTLNGWTIVDLHTGTHETLAEDGPFLTRGAGWSAQGALAFEAICDGALLCAVIRGGGDTKIVRPYTNTLVVGWLKDTDTLVVRDGAAPLEASEYALVASDGTSLATITTADEILPQTHHDSTVLAWRKTAASGQLVTYDVGDLSQPPRELTLEIQTAPQSVGVLSDGTYVWLDGHLPRYRVTTIAADGTSASHGVVELPTNYGQDPSFRRFEGERGDWVVWRIGLERLVAWNRSTDEAKEVRSIYEIE